MQEAVTSMTVAEKLQADYDSYTEALRSQGDIMAVVNASAEIAAKQNILNTLTPFNTMPDMTEEQRIALVSQDDLLQTIYERMQSGQDATVTLQNLAEELAPTPAEPEPHEEAETPEIQEETEQQAAELLQGVVPLYRESFAYASEHGELDQYRASRRENSDCASAITNVSYDHYNDNILDSETIYAELCE